MKLLNKTTVQSNHTGRTIDFQLDMSNAGHLTEILRKQIYTRHDLAVSREYTTNALDEHAKHSITDPVVITLPTAHNGWMFTVRDSAKGLPAHEVEDLYVKYGASTKRESNEQAGCLGIGCKAAFAYTDTFNVTSYHDTGIHRYIATLTSSTGQLHHISSEAIPTVATNIAHGMLIEVPVPEHKVDDFNETTTDYLEYIPKNLIRVLIDRGSGIEEWAWPTSQYDNDTKTWKMNEDTIFLESDEASTYPWYFTSHNPMSKNSCVVTMGNVPYPIDTTNLSGEFEFIGNKSLVVEAPLGSMSIAANREEIQYDDRSALTLQQIDKEIARTVQQRIQDTIDQSTTWKDALETYREAQKNINPSYRNSYYGNTELWKQISDYTWQGEQLKLTRKATDIRYSEHIRKNRYSNAEITPYTWSHDHQGVHYDKSSDEIKLVQHDGQLNRVYLWDPQEMSQHKMKQYVGYNHRHEEKDEDHMINWVIIYPRVDSLDPSNAHPDYDELKAELSYLGEQLKEIKDLKEPPRKNPIQQFTAADGTTIQTTRSPSKYVCQIDCTQSRQTDRLQSIEITEDNPLKPSIIKGTKEIFLFFPFLRHKLLLPRSEVPYPYQTEAVGLYKNYRKCPLAALIELMDPNAEIQHGHDNYNWYGIPAKRKLPENGMWFHDYITHLFDEFSTSKLYKDRCAWEAVDPHDQSGGKMCRQDMREHCLFPTMQYDLYENSTIPLLKELRLWEETIAQDIYNDCEHTPTIRKLFKDHCNYNNKNPLDLRKWYAKYDLLLKRFPLLPTLNQNKYIDKWHNYDPQQEPPRKYTSTNKVYDLTWLATQKYIKAPVQPLEEALLAKDDE